MSRRVLSNPATSWMGLLFNIFTDLLPEPFASILSCLMSIGVLATIGYMVYKATRGSPPTTDEPDKKKK